MLSPIDLTPAINDLDARRRIMDRYDRYVQVLTLAGPPLDAVVSQEAGIELSKLVNDEMAELVAKYPDYFVSAAATLPLHDMDASLKELERAIEQLGFRALQMHTPCADKPLDREVFFPLYEMMSRYNLPILLHPMRRRSSADYPDEDHSRYWIWQVFGWPYESTTAMARMVFSGVLDAYPELKFIIHHCGAMIPFFAERIDSCYTYAEVYFKTRYSRRLRKPIKDYFRMFYADTALHGNPPALMCGYDFYGADHILFATDMPHDSQGGDRNIRDTIAGVEKMAISEDERRLIFEDNARRLMRLPI
jgi:predicted TIM-barrel fold metal-dependent hydrolase